MPLQISNAGNVFSTLKLAYLDSINNAKIKYPFFSEIINNGRNREMDEIITKIHSSISQTACDIIVKLKNKLIN